jgi:iron complex transport system ATP-binding protein
MKDGKLVKFGSVDEIIRDETLQGIFDMGFNVHEMNGSKICLYYT